MVNIQSTLNVTRKRLTTMPRSSKKRGYSREFTPHGETGKRYLLDDIPAGFWRDVRWKAKQEGRSVRQLILKLLEVWLKDGA
jgi:hypothetical protein